MTSLGPEGAVTYGAQLLHNSHGSERLFQCHQDIKKITGKPEGSVADPDRFGPDPTSENRPDPDSSK